jgi:hypothetical protein
MEGRNNKKVRLGRAYQKISPGFSFLDYPFRFLLALQRKKSKPFIFVVGPPRSGTTLAYQVIHTGINSFYLSNLWNLLYATPALGGIISLSYCRKKSSGFTSTRGFVSGLCGEAEGMKFWEQWMGQGLEEKPETLDNLHIEKIGKIINYLGSSNLPFVSGYIGHSFSMEFLRKYFSNAVFIHITRSLVSNGYSLFKTSPERWFSLLPRELKSNNESDRKLQVTNQLISIHRKILESSKESDTFMMNYEELCNDPRGKTEELIEFIFRKKGWNLEEQIDNLPDSFSISKYAADSIYSQLKSRIEKVVEKEQSHTEFFQQLLY